MATVLRQAGIQVRMVVARPVETTTADFQNLTSSAPIVPTKILTDPEELDRQLVSNGFAEVCNSSALASDGDSPLQTEFCILGNCNYDFSLDGENLGDSLTNNVNSCSNGNTLQSSNSSRNENSGKHGQDESCSENHGQNQNISQNATQHKNVGQNERNSANVLVNGDATNGNGRCDSNSRKSSYTLNAVNCDKTNRSRLSVASSSDSFKHVLLSPLDLELALPETERVKVQLRRNEYGLGITVAGYVCEREDLSGIFVKSLAAGSDAHKCGKIWINDRIIEVNGVNLQEFTNHQAVEELKKAGSAVELSLERYLRGPKYEHLQEALASQEVEAESRTPSPSATTLSWIPIDTEAQVEPEGESVTTIGSEIYQGNPENREIFVDENFEGDLSDNPGETLIKNKWEKIVGSGTEIVVAHLTKLKGLGISLEGTVDVEGGIELRPHHYIRSILPEGPVGQNGLLSSGDELLEVNGQKLLGIKVGSA